MFDLETGVWIKPSAHTKQRKEHRVPLSAAARQLLAEIKVDAIGQYVFRGRKNGPLTDIKRTWVAACAQAGIHDCRIHDLRHTYASILASAGLSLPIIGALLGHTQPQTTARYAHLQDDPLRSATERVGAVVTANIATRRDVADIGKGNNDSTNIVGTQRSRPEQSQCRRTGFFRALGQFTAG